MRISTNEISSVVLSPKGWKSEKKCDEGKGKREENNHQPMSGNKHFLI
jgi:hypothetical protein